MMTDFTIDLGIYTPKLQSEIFVWDDVHRNGNPRPEMEFTVFAKWLKSWNSSLRLEELGK